MYNLFRTQILGTKQELIDQERYVHETQRFHGSRATQFVNGYQNDRRWKSNYILVEVISQGFDIKRFLEALSAEKRKCIFDDKEFYRYVAQHRLLLKRRPDQNCV